jgi:hypothetical protein
MNEYNYLIIILINSVVIYLFCLQYFEHPLSYKLNNIYERTVTVTGTTRCPHIIHQIVPDLGDVPSGLYHTIKHNIKLNPEFEYRIYDYNMIDQILLNEFDEITINAYNSTLSYKIKTDYIKLLFILRYGGIFIDIKNICQYKLINLIRINNVFYIHNLKNDSMDLSLLASHANNMAIRNTVKEATSNLLANYYGKELDEIAGGKLLERELFYIGYLVKYALLSIDEDNIVKYKPNKQNILKIYNSFNKENRTNNLLQDSLIEWNERILYI